MALLTLIAVMLHIKKRRNEISSRRRGGRVHHASFGTGSVMSGSLTPSGTKRLLAVVLYAHDRWSLRVLCARCERQGRGGRRERRKAGDVGSMRTLRRFRRNFSLADIPFYH